MPRSRPASRATKAFARPALTVTGSASITGPRAPGTSTRPFALRDDAKLGRASLGLPARLAQARLQATPCRIGMWEKMYALCILRAECSALEDGRARCSIDHFVERRSPSLYFHALS
jgi:hypothetical protein